MSQVTNCAVCSYNRDWKFKCKWYPDGIPDDVVCEIVECEHFTVGDLRKKENRQ